MSLDADYSSIDVKGKVNFMQTKIFADGHG